MKILFSVLLFCFVVNLDVWGQQQLVHPPKIFKNDAGKIFVNRHQPMYLFLGTSPDAAEAQTLTSESSPQYSNPFYFDSEGYNTVRTPSQVDTVTRKVVMPLTDIIFEVHADGLAPTTFARFSTARKYVKSGKVIYGPDLGISFAVSDKVSGVESIYYSLDGAPFKVYSDTIKLKEEKAYSLKYYSVDNVGNAEKVKSSAFELDLTPPVVAWKLDGDISGSTYSGRTKIEIIAEDDLAGVKNVYYQIDDKPKRSYRGPVSLAEIPSGDHTFSFFAMDNVYNSSKGGDMDKGMTVKAFIIDQTPPSASSLLVGDAHRGKYLYASSRTKVKLEAEDDQLGINKINYSINSEKLDKTYGEPFPLLEKSGVQVVRYRAYDMVNNRSVLNRMTVYLDDEAPLSGIKHQSPKFFARDTLFINKNTKISLFSSDNASGVGKVEYQIDGGDFVEGKELVLSESGFHTIGFRSVDRVNNVEVLKKSEVVVDNGAPDIYVNFSIKPIREEKLNGETIEVYPPYVNMYIGATDRYCGTQSIFYTIDGGVRRNYAVGQNPSDVQMFNKQKDYSVVVEAVDKLGNVGKKVIKFRVAKR